MRLIILTSLVVFATFWKNTVQEVYSNPVTIFNSDGVPNNDEKVKTPSHIARARGGGQSNRKSCRVGGCSNGRVCVPLASGKFKCRKPDSPTSNATVASIECSSVGESCGGFINNARQCCSTLTCKYSNVPDLPGTCTNNTVCSKSGETCGGYTLVPKSCCSNYVCSFPPEVLQIPDLPGRCIPSKSG